MLVEIPDPDVILSVIAAFVVGLVVLFVYYKVKPFINFKQKGPDTSHLERLEYYERQLIDMKIRMDALEFSDLGMESPQNTSQPEKIRKEAPVIEDAPTQTHKNEVVEKVKDERMPNLGYSEATDHVLGLITNKAMTSRDIQITIGRTREHTSRLMKKLFEDGFVQRNTNTKPYTYSITDKGKQKIGVLNSVPSIA